MTLRRKSLKTLGSCFMRPTVRVALAVCLTMSFGVLGAGQNARPASPDAPAATSRPTAAVSSVRGTVTAESEVPLDEMVVYLESPDAGRAMPPPGKAVDVSQKDARFEPRLVVVTVGQTVNFLNNEERAIEHNV